MAAVHAIPALPRPQQRWTFDPPWITGQGFLRPHATAFFAGADKNPESAVILLAGKRQKVEMCQAGPGKEICRRESTSYRK